MGDRMSRGTKQASGFGIPGSVWFMGWLFTIAYADLAVGQSLLALILWPDYLGVALR